MDKKDKYEFTRKIHGEKFTNKLQEIEMKLEELEKEYNANNESFDIQKYWTWNKPSGSNATFNTTNLCTDEILKDKIMQIFRDVLS